jgi:Na+-translocating ferredoxin:NAD+ oxidoreductase RnfE subunit
MTVHYPLPSWLTYSATTETDGGITEQHSSVVLLLLLCLLLRDDTTTTMTSKHVLGMGSICFLLYDGMNEVIRRLGSYASRDVRAT